MAMLSIYLKEIVLSNVDTKNVVEVAPCVSMNAAQREKICQAAVQLMKHVGYINAGGNRRVFVVEGDNFYFIESESSGSSRALPLLK